MKYLKLYEHWLNEAETLKFDLAKPDVFPITDLTQLNLYGVKPKDTEIVLKSILSKSFNSVETSEVPLDTVKIYGFYHLKEFKNGGLVITNEKIPNREFLIKTPDISRADVEVEFNKLPMRLDDKDARVYVVAPTAINDSLIFWKSAKAEGISTLNASVIILPPKPKNIQGFAIDAPGIIIHYGKIHFITIGQLITFASKKFSKEASVNLGLPEIGKREFLVANIFKKDNVEVGGPKI